MSVPRTFALVTGILFGLGASAANAQPREEENVNLALTGDIVAIDPDARKLTVKSTFDDEKGLVYEVEDSATIMYGHKKVPLGDLKVGWNVGMNGHRVGDTRRVSYIKVVKSPSP